MMDDLQGMIHHEPVRNKAIFFNFAKKEGQLAVYSCVKYRVLECVNKEQKGKDRPIMQVSNIFAKSLIFLYLHLFRITYYYFLKKKRTMDSYSRYKGPSTTPHTF